MEMVRYAYFVVTPRRITDLMVPHRLELERPYIIQHRILLSKIDYENSTTDLLADRQFIEDYAKGCSAGEIWRVLLIQRRGARDGVLVLPENEAYVKYAAYVSAVEE